MSTATHLLTAEEYAALPDRDTRSADEILGYYDPMAKPFAVKMDEEKVKGWIAQGGQFDWLEVSHEGIDHDAATG